jgi:hypothetical protein
MVLGSAFWAFNEICPERFDMLHPHFRKVCHLLADIDEWGQVATLNTLTRYARTQFKNPEAAVKVSSFMTIVFFGLHRSTLPSRTTTGETREEEEQAIVARGFGQL